VEGLGTLLHHQRHQHPENKSFAAHTMLHMYALILAHSCNTRGISTAPREQHDGQHQHIHCS
jgi:hypothetical protein